MVRSGVNDLHSVAEDRAPPVGGVTGSSESDTNEILLLGLRHRTCGEIKHGT